MASTRISKSSLITIMFLLFCLVLVSAAHEEDGFAKNMERKVRFRREKLSHFRFYWHNTLSGTNPSAVRIIQPLSKFALKSKFGLLDMTDNPLTEKPELSSKLLGRSQGIYAVTSQEKFDLLMAMNFVFVQGKYNGSTITIFGRNPVFNKVREMPVIGGSGLFRFARGYAHANTYTYDTVSGDAIVKYNVYVLHY